MKDNEIYDKSLDMIKEAMKTVIAEFVIKLEDGSSHIVYITRFEIIDNKITYDFCTPSIDRAGELEPHVRKIFEKQVESMIAEIKSIKPLSF